MLLPTPEHKKSSFLLATSTEAAIMSKKPNWADDESSDDEHGGPGAEAETEEYGDSVEASATEGGDTKGAGQRDVVIPKQIPEEGPFIAFVGNLKFDVNENQIGNFFYDGGCRVQDVKIRYDEFRKPKGIAFVEFVDRESLEKALTADGVSLGGRNIRVDVHQRKQHDRERDSRPPRAEEENWTRRQPRGEPGKRDGPRRQQDRHDRPSRGDPTDKTEEAHVPAVRPKLNILPRSKPVEPQQDRVASTNIFGDGKARSAQAQEAEKRKKAEVEGSVGAEATDDNKPKSANTGSLEIDDADDCAKADTDAEPTSKQRREVSRKGSEREDAGRGRGGRGPGRGGKEWDREGGRGSKGTRGSSSGNTGRGGGPTKGAGRTVTIVKDDDREPTTAGGKATNGSGRGSAAGAPGRGGPGTGKGRESGKEQRDGKDGKRSDSSKSQHGKAKSLSDPGASAAPLPVPPAGASKDQLSQEERFQRAQKSFQGAAQDAVRKETKQVKKSIYAVFDDDSDEDA